MFINTLKNYQKKKKEEEHVAHNVYIKKYMNKLKSNALMTSGYHLVLNYIE